MCSFTTVGVRLTEFQSKGEKFAINVVNDLKDPEMWLSTSVVRTQGLDPNAAFILPSALARNLSKRYKLC